MKDKVMLLEMPWHEARRRAQQNAVAVIPMGSIEEHGPHLPVGTDVIYTEGIVKRAAEIAAKQVPIVVLPTFAYNVVWWAKPFFSIGPKPDTLQKLLREIIHALVYQGFRKIVLFQGHAGNTAPWTALLQLADEGIDAHLFDVNLGAVVQKTIRALGEEAPPRSGHGGWWERSVVEFVRPDCVYPDLIPTEENREKVKPSNYECVDNGDVKLVGFATRTPHGYTGCPELGSRELGEKFLELAAKFLAEIFIEIGKKEPAYPTPREQLEQRVPIDS